VSECVPCPCSRPALGFCCCCCCCCSRFLLPLPSPSPPLRSLLAGRTAPPPCLPPHSGSVLACLPICPPASPPALPLPSRRGWPGRAARRTSLRPPSPSTKIRKRITPTTSDPSLPTPGPSRASTAALWTATTSAMPTSWTLSTRRSALLTTCTSQSPHCPLSCSLHLTLLPVLRSANSLGGKYLLPQCALFPWDWLTALLSLLLFLFRNCPRASAQHREPCESAW
jgi:hypothetical protein